MSGSGRDSPPYTSEQVWIRGIMMAQIWLRIDLDGLLSMESYSFCHVTSTYQFMEHTEPNTQGHSFRYLINTFLYAEDKY